jgi:hypothetical protein
MRYPEAKFYYGDLKAMDVLLNDVIGTERAKHVWQTIKL